MGIKFVATVFQTTPRQINPQQRGATRIGHGHCRENAILVSDIGVANHKFAFEFAASRRRKDYQ